MQFKEFVRRRNALTPVISAVLATVIVVASVGVIITSSTPYIEEINSKQKSDNVKAGIDSVVNAITDSGNSIAGDKESISISGQQGCSVSIDKNKDRIVLWYAKSNNYKFAVTGLENNDSSFNIIMNSSAYGITIAKIYKMIFEKDTCFLAGTKVLMADGTYQNIENVKVGDKVKSYNEQTSEIQTCSISNIFHHDSYEMTDYYLIINGDLKVTPNHRFYSDKKWVYADDLNIGSQLYCFDKNSNCQISSIEKIYEKVPTFDLEIDYCHTYFVDINGNFDVLVHNPTLNRPPSVPSIPSGPVSGTVGVSYNYSTSAVDPDGDRVYYWFDWGDGTNSGWVGPYNSGVVGSASHSWGSANVYLVKAKAKDFNGTVSVGWSGNLSVVISLANRPPSNPSKPSGAASGIVGVSYSYSTSAIDPDGNQVYYWFDWGDSTSSGWVGPYNSGVVGSASHSWDSAKIYPVKAKAKDASGAESAGYSGDLPVTLGPANQSPSPPSDPLPAHNSINVPLPPLLSVFVSDPDRDNLAVSFYKYDAFNGISTLLVTNYNVPSDTRTSYVWNSAQESTTYKWYVTVNDSYNANVSSDIWTFTTANKPPEPPDAPTHGNPPAGAIDVDILADLSWFSVGPPQDYTYDVYFDTKGNPSQVSSNQTSTTYDPGKMNISTVYFWKVVVWDGGVSNSSPVWSFSTEGPNQNPDAPNDPNPLNDAIKVEINSHLSWKGSDPDKGDTLTYDVYFGTSSNPSKVSSNQHSKTYNPSGLSYNTKYYWKIVAWDHHGAFNTSDIWSFTTKEQPAQDPQRVENIYVYSTETVALTSDDGINYPVTSSILLEGTIAIDLYKDATTYVGSIWIFDSDSLTAEFSLNTDIKQMTIENGVIIYSTNANYTYIGKNSCIRGTNNALVLSINQLSVLANSSRVISGEDIYKITVESLGSAIGRMQTDSANVYGLGMLFYGDHSSLWETYFIDYRFNQETNYLGSNTNPIVYNNGAGVTLMLSHSFLTLNMGF